MERVFKPRFKIPNGARINHTGINAPGIMTWENARNKFTVAVVHYTADPNKRSEEWFQKNSRNMRQDQIDRELEIDFESKAGQKAFGYLLENPGRWQIENISLREVPKHWRVIASLDYGTTSPTALYLWGIDEQMRFHALFEFYKPSSTREITAVLKGEHEQPRYQHPLWKRIEKVVADPSIFKNDQNDPASEELRSVADLIRDFGIPHIYKGTNNRMAGLDRVHDMLRHLPNNPNAEPYLFFCKRCVNMWRELTNIVYEELPPHLLATKNQKEDIVAKDDHAYDSLRYALMSVAAPSGEPEKAKPAEGSLGEFENWLDKRQNKDNEVDFF